MTCNASKLQQATLQINGCRKTDVSVDEMTVFYEENGEIKMKQGDCIYG